MTILKYLFMVFCFMAAGVWVALASGQNLYGHAVFMFGLGLNAMVNLVDR